MKRFQPLFLIFFVALHVSAQSPELGSGIEAMRLEALEFNKTVTDQEMVEFFELIYKYHPRNLADFQNQTAEERDAYLAEVRIAHNEVGVKLSTLRGMDEEQLLEMDALAKWDAEQAVLAEDAISRLRNYSIEEYRIIVDEAAKLVSNYDSSSADHLDRQTFLDDFPGGLAFIRPDMIHVVEDWCLIYLQKGIGRGIGYHIDQSDSGEWTIAGFNEHVDWGRTRIELDSPHQNE